MNGLVLAVLLLQTPVPSGAPKPSTDSSTETVPLDSLVRRFAMAWSSDAATGREILRAKDLTLILAPSLSVALWNGSPRKLAHAVIVADGQVCVPAEIAQMIEGKVDLRKSDSTPRKNPPPKKKWFTIVIDPGHGGRHTGCRGRSGILEKDIALDVALRLRPLLDESGGNVLLTRTDDRHFAWEVEDDLQHRVEIVNRASPDLFLSVHVNYVDRPEPCGFEVWMRKNDRACRELAGFVRAEFDRALPTDDRGIVNDYRGLRVLKGTACPAVLVEVGFISNPVEERRLSDPSYRQKVATALAEAVKKYLATRR